MLQLVRFIILFYTLGLSLRIYVECFGMQLLWGIKVRVAMQQNLLHQKADEILVWSFLSSVHSLEHSAATLAAASRSSVCSFVEKC